jgi:hypothetical protein
MKNVERLHISGFVDLNSSELLKISGGDTGYYGQGADLQRLADNIQYAANFIAGFFNL